MSLTQYSYGSGNWAEFVSRCEKTGKGFIALSLTNYDNNNACEIAEGSVVEINGAIFRQEAGNTTITGTPENNAINYIMLSAANNAAAASWNNAAPSWNNSYQGYYVGNNRYIGGCYFDGANYARKWIYKKGDSIEHSGGPNSLKCKIINIGDWDMNNSSNVHIDHGLGNDFNRIRMIKAFIRNDVQDGLVDLERSENNTVATQAGCIGFANATGIRLYRTDGGLFDSTVYDSTSFNRGWITIWYE